MMNKQCPIFLITIFCLCCAFVGCEYSLDQLAGKWVVRNSSQLAEIGKCPFVDIYNTTRNGTTLNGTAMLWYKSQATDIRSNMKFTGLNDTALLTDSADLLVGNITLLKVNSPYYMVVRMNYTKQAFMVLAGRYNLSKEMDREITEFWTTQNSSKNVSLNSTLQGTIVCNQFLEENDFKDANSSYPSTPSKPDTPLYPANKPSQSGTTQKPKAPKNATNRSTYNILLTTILVYLASYSA